MTHTLSVWCFCQDHISSSSYNTGFNCSRVYISFVYQPQNLKTKRLLILPFTGYWNFDFDVSEKEESLKSLHNVLLLIIYFLNYLIKKEFKKKEALGQNLQLQYITVNKVF